jgi:hypothetical protein
MADTFVTWLKFKVLGFYHVLQNLSQLQGFGLAIIVLFSQSAWLS